MMLFSVTAVAVFAISVAAAPAQQNEVNARAPEPTPVVEEKRWGSWDGLSWETRTWGSATWTQPVGVTGTPVPPSWQPDWQPGWQPGWEHPSPSPCLTPAQATVVANNFRDTIASPFNTAAVEASFSQTFTDYSDSVTELINGGCNGPLPLGAASFSSLQAFIDGQTTQAPIPFTILNLWNTCNSVHVRWDSTPGPGGPANPQQQVTGIQAIEVVPNPVEGAAQPWLIQTVYSEFNSGAWLYDLGIFTPTNCSAA